MDDGLAGVKINHVYNDSTGVIWVATESGLSRYDGAKFVSYSANDNDSLALRHNMVRYVMDYDRAHLLVASHAGIQLLDKARGTFSQVASNPQGETFGNFNNFLKRSNGEIWASGNSLVKVIVEGDKVRIENLDTPLPVAMTERLYEDSKGNVWLSKFGEGIYRMTPSGAVSQYLSWGNDSNVRTFCESADGIVLVSTAANSLYRYNEAADRFDRVSLPQLKNALVTSMLALPFGNVLVGTDGKGLVDYHPRSGFSEILKLGTPSFRSSRIKVHSITMDNVGNLWFGLYQKGLCILPADNSAFQFIGSKSAICNLIGDCCVTALHFDKSKNVLVGTDHDGIYCLGSGLSNVRHIENDPLAGKAPDVVVGLYEDHSGKLWFGSYNGGFGWLDIKAGRCQYLDREKSVYSFAEDKFGRVWMASIGEGLLYYDKQTGTLVRDKEINRYLCQWINDLYISRENVLYAATFDGLYIFDVSSRDVTGPRRAISYKLIRCVAEDSKGNISVGTSDGLYIFDRTAQGFSCITEENGLANRSVEAIQYDIEDNLWLTAGSAISKIDGRSGAISNYYSEDGVLAGEFSQATSCLSPHGLVFFGGSQGVTFFDPKQTEKPAKSWPVRMTGLYLDGVSVESGMLSGRTPIYQGMIFDADKFSFDYADRSFTVEIATKDFGAPASIRFGYCLDGGSEEILPREINTIMLKDVPSGKHTLSFWSEVSNVKSEVKTIEINVDDPWWFSTVARIIMLLLMCAFAVFFILLARRKHLYKEQLEINRHQEELTEAREQFFTNISHEIRAPMSLIMSPLKSLMDTDEDEGHQKNYSVIYRNSQRILQLVNQLMDVRKIDSGQMKLTYCPTMIVSVLESIYDLFKPQAASKNITLDFDRGGCDDLVLWVDPSSIDKIFVNLLSNAIKYTPNGGEVNVRLSADENIARISVSDTGMGISTEDLPRVFDRFFQSSAAKGKMGSGIGLNLTRSLVELHKGTISVESEGAGKGSTFIVELPVGCAHISDGDKSLMTVIAGSSHKEELVDNSSQQDQVRKNKTRRRILVVDDDNEIVSFLGDQLSADYYLQTASNGKEAMEMIFKNTPDLVLTDLAMPEMDGIELCRKIRANINFNHLPIIVLSGNVSDADRIACLESGADSFMAKPFNLDLLRAQIDSLISNRDKLKVTFGDKQVKQEVVKPTGMLTPDEKLLERVMKVVNENISNEKLTVDMVAYEVGLSRVHLYRKLKELTNQPPHDFIRNARLMKAAAMFAEKKHSVSEVAYSVGFSSPANFSTAFRQLFGMSPSEYGETHRKE